MIAFVSLLYIVILFLLIRYFYWRGWVHAHNVASNEYGVCWCDSEGGYVIAEFHEKDKAVEYLKFLEKAHPVLEGAYDLTGKPTLNDGSTRFNKRLLNLLVSR